MTLAWVLGGGGLLGSALRRTLSFSGAVLFTPKSGFCWTNSSELLPQINEAIQAFTAQAAGADRWEVYWAAGTGTMSSKEEALVIETQALDYLLKLLKSDRRLMAIPGAVAFASSAGALYAGASEEIITENTLPTPTTAYAREKLRQEGLFHSFLFENERTTALVARISTLYGVGQSSRKPQGLLSHIARSLIRRQPVQIYVPYDTIRDYISADDAAVAIVNALRLTSDKRRFITKIIASEHPVTIAEIISIFKRIERRAPLIITSANKLSSLYARRVQFRSIATPEYPKTSTKSLLIGIAQIMTAERAAFVRGRVI